MNEVLQKCQFVIIKFIVFSSILVLIFTSCFPLIKESSVPPIDKNPLLNLFKNENERILVLPLWEKYPVVMSEKSISESSTLSLSPPLFLKVKDIEEIHNLIPSKISTGMIIGPGGAVGRGVFFYGLYIISEFGRTIFLKSEYQKAKLSHAGFISEEEKKELVNTFRESKEIFPSPASKIWFFTKSMKLKINYSSSCRNDIINFINDIDLDT